MAVRFADVADWIDGRLDTGAAARVAAAVAADPGLRAAAEWYRSFLATSASMPLERPPQHVRDLLMRRFASYRPPAPGFVQRVRAAISFDSATATLALGFRAADTGVARHIVVESDVLDIALDLYPEDRAVRLEGQLLPRDPQAPATGTVRLVRGEVDLAAGSADDAGRFSLPPVPPGDAVVVAEVGGVSVEVGISVEV